MWEQFFLKRMETRFGTGSIGYSVYTSQYISGSTQKQSTVHLIYPFPLPSCIDASATDKTSPWISWFSALLLLIPLILLRLRIFYSAK